MCNSKMQYTVEPPNSFVLCREVVLSSEVKNVLLSESEHLGHSEVSFIERLFLLCPLFGGSTIGDSCIHVELAPLNHLFF